MSDCRNLGSNYFPSSQSRKISIGLMADSVPKRRLRTTKSVESARPRTEILNSTAENTAEANHQDEGTAAGNARNQTEAPDYVSSPWITTRCQKFGTLEAVLSKQTSGLPSSKGIQKNLNGVKHPVAIGSVQLLPNLGSTFQSNDGEQNLDKSSKEKHASPKRVEEFTFATAAQEAVASDKGVPEEKADKMKNRSTEALRAKLLEILGTVSSPRSHHSNSQAPDVGTEDLKLDKNVELKGDKLVKPRQNSDTIETDSESSDDAPRRPVTRSLLRKRAPIKGRQKKTKSGASSSYKNKGPAKSIFSFEEGWRENLDGAVNFSSAMRENKKARRKSTVVEPLKIDFPEKDEGSKVQKETCQTETPEPAQNLYTEKTSPLSNEKRSFNVFPPEKKSHFQKPQTDILEEDFHQSQATKTKNQLGVSNGLSENEDKQEAFSNPFVKNIVDPQDDFQSPTFGFKTPISSPPQHFSPETVQIQQSDHSPAQDKRTAERNFFSFRTRKTSKGSPYESKAERNLSVSLISDFSEKLQDSSSRRETSSKLNEESEGLSESSSDERDSNISGEDSPVMERYNCHRETDTSPHDSSEKSKFLLHPLKRNHGPDGARVNPFGPTLSSPKGVDGSNCFQELSGQNQEDGLGRAVTSFALALQNFERKLKSAARKKSSEILVSVSDGIHLQLQNIQSHMLTDVRKLASLCKSKRKHMETRLQDQHEQLKLMHEKFKEQVTHHLQDFRSTVEELEANKIELKGSLKKQKVSHQKLIMQLEGEVETRIGDAQRRITAVNESARIKMLQLKKSIAECLKDGTMD